MLAILATHPIQYQVALWKALQARGKVPFRVFYMSDLGLEYRLDKGFGRKIAWDIDLLSGYDSEFMDVKALSSQESFLWLRLKTDFGRMLRDRQVRVLWMQGWQVAAYWQAAWQARRFKIQVWLRGDTHLRKNGAGPVQRIKRVALRRLLNRVDRFLCVGEANRQFYLSQKIPAERMTSAPHCVDNARFAAEVARLRPQRQKIRSYWHIDDRAFCLLFVGKFTPGKRPLDLIMAVREFQKANIDRALHILFVGTGELERELRQSCVIASDVDGCSGGGGNGNPTASFAGFLNQTQISQAYVAADCLVLPSASETWGLVVNEAMASGLPCVTSDACGCVEDLILPISPELVYPAGDIARLQQSLKAVMAHPPSRSLLEAHIDGYNPLRTVMMVEQLYLQAIAHQPVCC